MHPLHSLYAAIILLIAIITAYILIRITKTTISTKQFESIDGLRGFLALNVFIHHTSIWHQYLQTGSWEWPKSALYSQLGNISVSLFFMITSFLFVSKILNAKDNGFNWRDFYISRFFRIAPLFYFSLLVILVIIAIISQGKLLVKPIELIQSIFHWSIFSIYSSPSINNFDYSFLLNEGILWTIPYEWLFYFCLPILSLFIIKIRYTYLFIIFSIVFILLFLRNHQLDISSILSFVGGAIAPFLMKYDFITHKAKSIYASLLIIVCIIIISQYDQNQHGVNMILTTILFTLIALGNTIFGLLKIDSIKFLGEISYSTYLLHITVLFIFFYFFLGFEKANLLSPLHYSLIIFSITPVLVFISFLGYKYIEKPFIDKSKNIILKLKERI